ncbi:MAG: type II secretion system GspH family protein [Alphaproteobacteria bacterium]|nr:type II secretion system GspH family protein [Alphaproteobacteria bacterium]
MLRTMSLRAFFSSSFNPSSEAGFSLLEMAIVMLIVGLVGGLSLPLLTAQINRAALVKTRANQEYVLNAIATYVEKNRIFPCPADPHVSGPDYGLEQKECQGKKGEGILPFKTLGISEVYAKDGFKHLMTYVVDPGLTNRKNQNLLQTVEGGQITVKNEEGDSILPQREKRRGAISPNFIAFLLISHGESGVGAFGGKGQSTKLSGKASPQKKENCDGNFIFIESHQSDDILRWETRDLFLKHYVRL